MTITNYPGTAFGICGPPEKDQHITQWRTEAWLAKPFLAAAWRPSTSLGGALRHGQQGVVPKLGFVQTATAESMYLQCGPPQL